MQVRQLESMIRLSEALARAHLDNVVQVRVKRDPLSRVNLQLKG